MRHGSAGKGAGIPPETPASQNSGGHTLTACPPPAWPTGNGGRLRGVPPERVRAHFFMCYLAYLLLSLLEYRLRQTELTAESALLELETKYKVYLRESKHRFRLSRIVTLTQNQERLLMSIDRSLLCNS